MQKSSTTRSLFSWLYDVALYLAIPILHFLSFFNPKLKKGINGRRNWKAQLDGFDSIKVWFHLASLGEYEQALPLIQLLSKKHGKEHVLISFFSPSGYDVVHGKNEHPHVIYLPWDTASNARYWVNKINPKLAVFTKYDLWFHYLYFLEKKDIPTILISAYFHPNKYYFKWYGRWMKNRILHLDHIFTQDERSLSIAKENGLQKTTLSGDTRIDRSLELPKFDFSNSTIEQFIDGKNVLILGSTHPEDDKLLLPWLIENRPAEWKVIVVPHDISHESIKQVKSLLTESFVLFSESSDVNVSNYMILDQVGVLKYVYRYADSVYIGGGFGNGIHNILEPISYGVMLAIGPKHRHFPEATALAEAGGLTAIMGPTELNQKFTAMFDLDSKASMVKQQKNFLAEQSGAAQKVMDWITSNIQI